MCIRDRVKDDFTLEYKVNDGAFEKAAIKEFTYNKDSKNVVMTFDKISGAVDPKDVTVKVTYKDVAKTAEFRVELGSGVKYYVDATNGKDSNNGTSPETAWQTIDRVNQEKFQPGDQILFKAGETWTGALKPQGSGAVSYTHLEKGMSAEGMLKILAIAKEERANGKQVMLVNMKKNKKFQKEQLMNEGYTDIQEIFKDNIK